MTPATIKGFVSRHSRLLHMGSSEVSDAVISANIAHIISVLPSLLQRSAKPQLVLKRASAEHDTLRVD